ncbi:unnamed protein product [Tuber melanosporum]|uniref:(Perigord truffle) hypothetical protein n=1 Tax=Tuber melanosporum (strain Mel28) TaxID=656061 RepID=D5GFB9_TUBMM|nr:uncharacterized protein GSTUM_00006816001 [Tuber melanosporum]CAZ83212.1 unnamed protein product [Tuber melanosporum]
MNRPTRPKGSHYQPPRPDGAFFNSILEPFTAIFSPFSALPPEAPCAPFSTVQESFELLDARILAGKSTSTAIKEYKTLKTIEPGLRLTGPAVIVLLRNLLKLGVPTPILEVLEMENLMVDEGIRLLRVAMEGLSLEQRRRVAGRLLEAEGHLHRKRFRTILSEEIKSFETEEVIVRNGSEYVKDIKKAQSRNEMRKLLDEIVLTKVAITRRTSQLIASRLVDLNELGLGVSYALEPLINISQSNFIATICDALCDANQYGRGYELIMKALKTGKYGLLSDLDMKRGVRTIDTMSQPHLQLYNLWDAMKSSSSIYPRDLSYNTYAAFLGRATKLRFGLRGSLREGGGETPLLTMSIEIIVRFTDQEKKMARGLISSMLEAWIWSWGSTCSKKPDFQILEDSIPFMAPLFNILPPESRDPAILMAVERTTTNCIRSGREVWPRGIIWPFVSTLAQAKIWQEEESIGLWATERVLLRKRLAPTYLRYRTDAEIARFVARHYLPLRLGLTGPKRTTRQTGDAERLMVRMRSLERGAASFPSLSVFALAILAFKDTCISSTTLLIDMLYTLHRLHRYAEIPPLLASLKFYNISPPRSDIARLIRLLTRAHPTSALELLQIYPDTQYSVFAQFIVRTATLHPDLALRAYQLLTPPTLHYFSRFQPKIPGRRLPGRKLLVAMGWNFANSPVLSPRQCLRYAQRCLRAMLVLGFDPGPRMGWAIAVAGVERAIHAEIPVRREWERMKWVLETVRRNAGPKRAREVDLILSRWEKNVWNGSVSRRGGQ